jgi:uncharacterized protein YndB with AHSA1/START domain
MESAMSETRQARADEDFVISRVFDAPRDLMWEVFTDPEHMKQWWGPKGFSVVVSKIDLRVGGTYHYQLKAPDGSPMWGRFVYREIVPPERIVLVSSFSDEAGGVTRHPMAPVWPLEMLSTFTFEALPDGRTRFTVRWAPHNATAQERNAFDEGRGSMTQGWSGTMEQLGAYLASIRQGRGGDVADAV